MRLGCLWKCARQRRISDCSGSAEIIHGERHGYDDTETDFFPGAGFVFCSKCWIRAGGRLGIPSASVRWSPRVGHAGAESK